jgi:hypothetical protein
VRYGHSVIGVILLSAGLAWGQASIGFGVVEGTVRDPNGEGIPDTRVVLSNASLRTQLPMNTTDDGVFSAPAVAPAAGYKLRVTRKNFTTWESSEFGVSTGQRLEFEVTIHPSEEANAKATGGLLPIDNLKSGIEATILPPSVSETPTSSLLIDPLATLVSTVTAAENKPGLLVFHGMPFSTLFMTDGLWATDTYFQEKDQGVANQLSVEAVQDFNVAAADYSAEFDGTMSGVINAATPSGTTAYHGAGYWYYRDPSFQANNRYAAGYNLLQTQNQGGISIGGPIQRARNLFFFLNVEALSRDGEGLNRITNPLIANPAGTLVKASNCLATAAECAVAERFLQSQFNVLEPLWDHSQRGLFKIDYRRSARNSFSLDGNALDWKAPRLAETEDIAPNGGMIGDPMMDERTRFANLDWLIALTSQFTNDARIGWYQDRMAEDATPTGLPTGSVGISIAGTIVGDPLAQSAILPSQSRFQAVDNATWTAGKHTLKAGFEYVKQRYYVNYLPYAAGSYTYPSLTAFAEDFSQTGQRNYATFDQTLGYSASLMEQREIAPYFQDTWRPTPRLTLDYGLRYERPLLPQPAETNPSYYQTGAVATPYLNLSPRVGFAYLLTKNTVLRGGFGFYYAPYSGQLLDALFIGNSLGQTSVTATPALGTSAPLFPNIYPSQATLPSGVTNVTYINSNFRNQYTQEISVALERRISSDTTLTLNLLHIRGLKLWTTEDANLTTPVGTETYNINNAQGLTVSTFNTEFWTAKNGGDFAHAYQIENGGSSWYNGANLELRKRMAYGLSAQASYTFSHAIDDLGQITPFGRGYSSTYNAIYTDDIGNSQFDQRHHAVIQLLYQPTLSGAFSKTVRRLVNGWQFSTITTIGSSQFDTPIAIPQGQQFTSSPMVYTTSLDGSGGWGRVPFLPVGYLPTGPHYVVDARLARTFAITERVGARFSFEAFNLLNMQYNTAVNTIAYLSVPQLPVGVVSGSTVGVLQPVPGLGNGIAAQGFPDGTNARRCQIGVRVVF